MRTSAPAGRHVRLVPTTASRLAHAALPDRDQAGVGLDQALRAEPGRLERDPNIQAGAIHTLDHPLLHGHTPLVGAPDGASAPPGRRHSPAGAAAFVDRLGPLEPRFGNSVQAITFHRRGSTTKPRRPTVPTSSRTTPWRARGGLRREAQHPGALW